MRSRSRGCLQYFTTSPHCYTESVAGDLLAAKYQATPRRLFHERSIPRHGLIVKILGKPIVRYRLKPVTSVILGRIMGGLALMDSAVGIGSHLLFTSFASLRSLVASIPRSDGASKPSHTAGSRLLNGVCFRPVGLPSRQSRQGAWPLAPPPPQRRRSFRQRYPLRPR
jgi:hypothetical protein